MRRFALVAPGLALALGSCAPADSDVVVLEFWAMGREGEVVQELIPEFEQRHPGIRVRVQQVPWTAAHEKLLTAYVGNSTPDLSQLGNTWIAEFTALGAIEPIDARLGDGATLVAEDYFRGIWETNTLEGVAYGVPWYVDTRLVFYRADILRQAGYPTFPEDWDGWVRAMEAVVRMPGETRYAILLPTNEFMQPVIFGMQKGSPLLRDEATRGAFSEPAFEEAFDFYLSLFERGLAPPVSNHEIANLYQEFARGYFAMYITGPWNLGEFARRLPDELQDDWATAPLPGPDGRASGLSIAGGSSLVLYRGSPRKAEAWKLIEYLSEPETQLRFYRLSGNLPSRIDAWQDSALVTDPRIRAFGDQLHRVVAAPKVPEWEQIATELLHRAESAIRTDTDPDSTLARLDRDVDRILEKRRWLLERRAAEPAEHARSGR